MCRSLTAAVLAVAVAAGCTHEPDREGRIVFESDRSGDWGIYSVRADGSDLGRVTHAEHAFSATTTSWSLSPDGERLFVGVERENRGEGFVVDMRTGRRAKVRVHALAGAAWSPDAERLAVGGERGIVVIDADGSNRRQLTHDPNDVDPAWSPDGSRIAFASGRDLFTVAPSGGPLARLVSVSSDEIFFPRWSADGRWIAFLRHDYDTAYMTLEVVRAGGGGHRRLARNADHFAWSPRGATLVFEHASDLYRVDPDGRDRRRLTFDGPGWLFRRSPTWSPDGQRIAYVAPRLARGARDPGRPTDIWVMNADGSAQRAVTRAFPKGGSNAGPEWVARAPATIPEPAEPRVTALRPQHVLRTRQPIGGIAAEGSRAVVVEGLGSGTEFDNPPGPLRVWAPTRRRAREIPVRGCGTAADPVIAGARVAFVCDNSVVDLIERDVRVSSGRTTRTVVRTRATHLVGARFRSRLVRGLGGSGSLIALGVSDTHVPVVAGWRTRSTRIWRADHRARLRELAVFDGVVWVADVDSGRVAVVEGKRAVRVLSAAGETLRRFALGRNQVLDAVLDGDRVVVLSPAHLTVFDLATSKRRARHPLPASIGEPRRLSGAHRNTVAYVAGLAIHVVRLSDRRELVVDTRSAAGPVYADLTEAGLFYSYTDPRRLPAGRAAFVPRAELERALARAG